MKSWMRTFGSFVYSMLISIMVGVVSILIWTFCYELAEGFWLNLWAAIFLTSIMGWISEKGISLLSIPFNWLWDNSVKSRLASTIPPLLIGIWVVSLPFRRDYAFTGGDIFLTVIWEILILFSFYNLCFLPWINLEMGVNKDD